MEDFPCVKIKEVKCKNAKEQETGGMLWRPLFWTTPEGKIGGLKGIYLHCFSEHNFLGIQVIPLERNVVERTSCLSSKLPP
jgi:hypothetical protein